MELLNRDSWTAPCMARHLGHWLIEPGWLREAISALEAGVFKPIQMEAATRKNPNSKPYAMASSGIAMVQIAGQMQKGESKFGGTNSIELRRQLRAAAVDDDVRGVMMLIDSPGGTVAGTSELASDIKMVNAVKPVYAHIEDLGASAAYWVASQASRVTATKGSEVGSVGVLALVEDSSGAAEKAGIKYHVISTGKYKGAGVPGREVTEEELRYFQERVDGVHKSFVSDIMSGRGLKKSQVEAFADGRVFAAEKAMDMGMIDEVARFDDAMATLRNDIREQDKKAITRDRVARASISIAEVDLDAM